MKSPPYFETWIPHAFLLNPTVSYQLNGSWRLHTAFLTLPLKFYDPLILWGCNAMSCLFWLFNLWWFYLFTIIVNDGVKDQVWGIKQWNFFLKFGGLMEDWVSHPPVFLSQFLKVFNIYFRIYTDRVFWLPEFPSTRLPCKGHNSFYMMNLNKVEDGFGKVGQSPNRV